MLEFYFRFWFLRLRHNRHVILHLPSKFCSNRTICDRVMTSYPFFNTVATASQLRKSTSGFGFRDFAHLRRSKSTCTLYFRVTSQSAAEILLLSVSENKRLPCWNFTSGSNFYVCVIIDMSFCICLSNFVQIGPSATELWRYIHFSTRWPRHRNSTSGFGFRNFAHMVNSKSTGIPNFGEISQSTAEILLVITSVYVHKRPPC